MLTNREQKEDILLGFRGKKTAQKIE